MSDRRLILRNVLSTIVAQLISFTLTLGVTRYLPGYVGAEGLGKLAFAGSFVAIFGAVVPLGTSTVLVQNIARDRSRAAELLLAAIALRLPLALVLAGVAVALVMSFGYPRESCILVAVAAAAMITTTLNDSVRSALQGQERLPRQSAVLLLDKIVLSATTILLVIYRAPLWAIGLASVLSGVISLGVSLATFRHSITSCARPSWSTIRWLVVAGLPFIGTTVFRALYGQTDPLVLRIVADDRTVGWYAAVGALLGMGTFLPSALSAAVFPTLTRLYSENPSQFEQLARRSVTILFMCAVPLSTALFCVPDLLLVLLHYPAEFAPTIPMFRVGAFWLLVQYAGWMLGVIVTAANGQSGILRASIVACTMGIPLCFVGSILGKQLCGNAALGALTSDLLLELYLVVAYIRLLSCRILDRTAAFILLRCLFAALPMALMLWVGARFGVVLWILAPSALVYVGICYLLGCFNHKSLAVMQLIGRPRIAASSE